MDPEAGLEGDDSAKRRRAANWRSPLTCQNPITCHEQSTQANATMLVGLYPERSDTDADTSVIKFHRVMTYSKPRRPGIPRLHQNIRTRCNEFGVGTMISSKADDRSPVHMWGCSRPPSYLSNVTTHYPMYLTLLRLLHVTSPHPFSLVQMLSGPLMFSCIQL